jgi:curved DNA-binding protein CbpA
MSIDYYKILEILPDANIETIKMAYRRRALKCHPDRGGSHEQMILVNEAWEILSNPITRANYDAARLNVENKEYVRKAEAEARKAREQADQYPSDWSTFETWMDKTLNSVISDFKKAEYGEMLDGKIPTAGQSFTGWIFIITGAALGLFATVLILSGINYRGSVYFGFYILIFGGAWLGKVCHEMMKDKLDTQKPFLHPKPDEKSPYNETIESNNIIKYIVIAIILFITFAVLISGNKERSEHSAQYEYNPPPSQTLNSIPDAAPAAAAAPEAAPAPSPQAAPAPAAQESEARPLAIPRFSTTTNTNFKYYGYVVVNNEATALIGGNLYHEGDFLGDDEYVLKSIKPNYVIISNKNNTSDFVVQMNYTK